MPVRFPCNAIGGTDKNPTMPCTPGVEPRRRHPRGGSTERMRLCDAHNGVAYAVATVKLEEPGAPTQVVALCRHHLELFESTLGGWSPD